jgi:hypothetical protein
MSQPLSWWRRVLRRSIHIAPGTRTPAFAAAIDTPWGLQNCSARMGVTRPPWATIGFGRDPEGQTGMGSEGGFVALVAPRRERKPFLQHSIASAETTP